MLMSAIDSASSNIPVCYVPLLVLFDLSP